MNRLAWYRRTAALIVVCSGLALSATVMQTIELAERIEATRIARIASATDAE